MVRTYLMEKIHSAIFLRVFFPLRMYVPEISGSRAYISASILKAVEVGCKVKMAKSCKYSSPKYVHMYKVRYVRKCALVKIKVYDKLLGSYYIKH